MKITNYIKMTVLTTALGSTTFADANVFDDARDMTIKANAYLNDNGRDVAFKTFNDRDEGFYDEKENLYVFVLDLNGNILASGEKDSIGMNISKEKTIYNNTKGYRIKQINESVQKQGWMSYSWDPLDSETKLPKSSYLIINDKTGLIVGVGAYEQ